MQNVASNDNLIKKSKWKAFLEASKTLFFENWKAYLFLLPTLLLLMIFTLWPILNAFRLSFLNGYNHLSKEHEGFGFNNYKALFEYSIFRASLANTFWYTLFSVPVSLALALLISVMMTRVKVLNKLFETLFFLPHITNAIAMGIVFAAIFSDNGAFAAFLKIFGISNLKFISPGSSLAANRFVIILYSIWMGLPFKIIILYSAIKSVPKQYYDAAKIDGASKWMTLRKITIPAISPMLLFLLITGFINGFKEYNAVVGVFGERMGPIQDEANTIVGFIYTFIRNPQAFYFAATASVILFLIILVVTAINWLLTRKKVHY